MTIINFDPARAVLLGACFGIGHACVHHLVCIAVRAIEGKTHVN